MPEPESQHILIVDDARDIREPLGVYLRRNGFRTSLAGSAAEARRVLSESAIHLVVLDVMMPGEDGLSLCRSIVADGGPPTVLLTAMAEETDRIVGLELGADDYVVKPFNPRELLARIRTILRRVPAPGSRIAETVRRFGDWVHDPARSMLTGSGGEVALTTRESRLLGIFLDNPNTVLSRPRLLDLTAGREAKPYDRAIDNTVSRLRRKIEDDPSTPRIIVTEWGGGYRLAVEVTEASGSRS